MEKHEWNNEDLEYKLKRLYYFRENETNFQKKEIISQDIANIEDILGLKKPTIYSTLLQKYKRLKCYYPEYKFLTPVFNEFADITSSFKLNAEKQDLELSEDEIITITHDFFKSLNNFFFGNFMDVFQKRKDHLAFGNINNPLLHGIACPIHTYKETYIKIYRNNTIDDILSTIHEYMHATSVAINPNHLFSRKYLYYETDSLFIEMLACDYLQELFKSDIGINEKVIAHKKKAYNARVLCLLIKLFEAESKKFFNYLTSEGLKENAYKIGFNHDSLDTITRNPNRYNESYILGYSLAIELYEMYKQDKDKALNLLKRLILLKDYYSQDMFWELKKIGLYPNSHLKEYQDNLEQEYDRIRTK